MSQSTLSTFSAPQTALPGVFDCTTCSNQQALFSIEGHPKVKCFGKLQDVPKKGCPSYSDNKDLDHWPPLAENYQLPKKWRGRA